MLPLKREYAPCRLCQLRLPLIAFIVTRALPLHRSFVTGSYVKYNNNLDWTEDKRNTPQAFSHWTYIQSEKQIMIVDIQVRRVWAFSGALWFNNNTFTQSFLTETQFEY